MKTFSGGIYSDIDAYSQIEYSEVEGAALVPSASGMDGYGALHGANLEEIRRTKLPVDVNPDQHNYSRLKKTASTSVLTT